MKIKITLLSDLCTCSGETYNSVVDMDVVYDENGIPYIPAKRVKGCIRESALELQEMGLITEGEYNKIFGRAGNQSAIFTLSNAYIKDYDETVAALKKCKYPELTNPQNVLNQYTYTRTQTSVNSQTGVANENSLRTVRVAKKGLEFEAECNCKGEDKEIEILKNAISLVKHIGVSRTRGLGLVKMELVNSEENPNEQSSTKIKRQKLGEKNKIDYVIKLNSAMMCKSATGNEVDTQDYIAGSKVLGLLAGEMTKKEYQEFISKDELIISNAYIMNNTRRCIPGKVSLQKEKDGDASQLRDMLYNLDEETRKKVSNKNLDKSIMDFQKELRDIQLTPANIAYMDSKKGTAMEVATEISYHHTRPDDKSIGRAAEKGFYQLASIRAGQKFGGVIYASKEQAEKILDIVESLKNVRMGYGRSTEFGSVDFQLTSSETIKKSKSKSLKSVELTLVSDLILYNEFGMLTTDIKVLKEYLEEILQIHDLEIINPFLKFETIGGYNVTWNRRKPIFNTLGKGSTMILHSETGIDTELLKGKFIGERVSEGYGEIELNEIPKSLKVKSEKYKESSKDEKNIKLDQIDLMKQLLQSEFKQRLQIKVRKELIKEANVYKKRMDELNAAIAKIRVIFKDAPSYEEMTNQVEKLVGSDKKNLCKDLLRVNPNALKDDIIKEIKKDYSIPFENQWDADKLYKETYRAYLAELKYFVRGLKVGGDIE